MRTEGSDITPYGDRRAEMPEGRPALSLNQFDMADYRSIQRDRMPAAGLPALELLNVRPGDRTAALQTDALQINAPRADAPRADALRTDVLRTDVQNRLRDRVASEFASPAMAGRGDRFLQDMNRFSERARASGLSAQEVSETYRNIERILQPGSDSRLSRGLRLALASQVMHNAAEPTEIRQNENTCSVASLEVRLYTRQPSAAAALVADVATRGVYTGSDGTTVRLDAQSLTPSRVGTVALTQEANQRSFASQLFQVTAANIANMLDPDFSDRRYAQRPPLRANDSGEALVNARTGEVVSQSPGAAAYPNGLIRASESITGRSTEAQAFLVNNERRGRTAALASHFDDADHLGNRLEQLNRAGQLPAIIFVYANSDLFPQRFSNIPGSPFSDGHFVSVTGYDPVTRMVRYDDQFGPESDRNTRPVSLQSLYDATHVVRANQWLDRLEASRERMTEAEFVRNLEQLGRAYAQRWQSYRRDGGSLPTAVEADRISASARFVALARELPPVSRQRVERSLDAPPTVSRR